MKARKITTTELPETYEGLCRLLPPRKIEDKASYGNAMEVLDAMAGIALNRDQEEYLDLLSDLVAGYEDKTVEMPKVPVTEVLKELIEESNMTQTSLAEVLGIDNALVTKILKGEREITVDLARTLARQFHVDASLFLVLPSLEDESTKPLERKNKKLGVWQKYRVTAEDYRRYHKRKIAFSGIVSRGKTLAGTGKLMLRTYKDMGIADIFVDRWFGNYGTTLILTLPEEVFRRIVETSEGGLQIVWNRARP
jgi:HTH-type transcriptional regulator / antitoxin HigA